MERIQITQCPNCGSRAISRNENNASERRQAYSNDWEVSVHCRDCNYLERFLGRWHTAKLSIKEPVLTSEQGMHHLLGQDSFRRLLPSRQSNSGPYTKNLLMGGSTARVPPIPSQ